MGPSSFLLLLAIVVLLAPVDATARSIGQPPSGVSSSSTLTSGTPARSPTRLTAAGRAQGKLETLQVAGSSLPDCSHACGSCKPCRLVMVSFVCASLEEAETCPMAYKCMCNRSTEGLRRRRTRRRHGGRHGGTCSRCIWWERKKATRYLSSPPIVGIFFTGLT
ncbi:epidermal patterning factor [Musa troglodytarum]|uniref:Epidermal patterning factor-like protein n=1 Tax=Musa troglodytarum TaxID=320322 RepID=A0A9E7GJD7_9LILI|nr:epidermal patterning factor [Musa troglodytarum]